MATGGTLISIAAIGANAANAVAHGAELVSTIGMMEVITCVCIPLLRFFMSAWWKPNLPAQSPE